MTERDTINQNIIQIKAIVEDDGRVGTFQDIDLALLSDGTVQYMFYFEKGRAAYQTGWTSINMEKGEDIPFPGVGNE